jgi:hypothetical protein
VELGWPGCFAGEAVFGGDTDVTFAAKEEAIPAKLLRVAHNPGAAVDEEDSGGVAGVGGRGEDVTAKVTAAAAAGTKDDPFFEGDAGGFGCGHVALSLTDGSVLLAGEPYTTGMRSGNRGFLDSAGGAMVYSSD